MNDRGSAYIFVLIMTMGILLMLAIVSTGTVYEAQVSKAYKDHSNLSLLAHSGIERAVYAINLQLDLDRGEIANATAEKMTDGDDYTALFIKEANSWLDGKFADTEMLYNLALPSDESYTVRVRITTTSGGFYLRSKASEAGLDNTEEVIANAICTSDADAEIIEGSHNAAIIAGDIGYRIEKLKQNR